MPEALDVDCLSWRIAPQGGRRDRSVVWVEKKKEPPGDFDDLVSRVASQKTGWTRSSRARWEQTRHSRTSWRSKFEEARKRARPENPNERPPNPFDNE